MGRGPFLRSWNAFVSGTGAKGRDGSKRGRETLIQHLGPGAFDAASMMERKANDFPSAILALSQESDRTKGDGRLGRE